MEKSLSKKSRVLQAYREMKADFPTDYFGPDNATLSSLPDYGKSNAALPRGEDPSVLPFIEKQSRDRKLAYIREEIAKIKKELGVK